MCLDFNVCWFFSALALHQQVCDVTESVCVCVWSSCWIRWYRSKLPVKPHSPVRLRLRLSLTFRTERTAISSSRRPPVTLAFRNATASSLWSQRAPVMFDITGWRKGRSFPLQENRTSWETLAVGVKKLKQPRMMKNTCLGHISHQNRNKQAIFMHNCIEL